MKHKRILLLLLSLVLSLGLAGGANAAAKTAADFPDYDSRAWYAEAMAAAVEDGLLRGTDKGLLNPQGNLTRAEMAAIINRSFGTYVKGDISQFTDVSRGAWYYEDVAMAYHMGTYEGRDQRTMAPDSHITRQEAMTVVARALQLDAGDYEDASLSQFRDRSEVSAWALPYVRAMVGADYIHGNEKRELTPQDPITRAEFAQIFYNIIQDYILAPGTYTEDYDGNLLVRTDDVTLRDLSFVLILTVYGRFFRLYMYTALSPVPLASFAGEGTASMGKAFIKSYVGVCMEGAVIILACLIYSAFLSSGAPAVDPSLPAVTMAYQYVGQVIFNMLVLTAMVKGAERIVREMFGL